MTDEQEPSFSRGSLDYTVYWLWVAGLRYGTVIDVGCAEGWFSLDLAEHGPFRSSTILNIDAQEEYRGSLSAIQAALGGQFEICAVGERDGDTIELQRGTHSYWSSVRPLGDRYWASHHEQHTTSTRVRLRSIDAIVAESALPSPYFLKLDVQGAELQALAGAERTLADTSVVVIETLLEDFTAIHDVLTRAGFDLFDITAVQYAQSGALGWFHPVYLNERHRGLRPVEYWDRASTQTTIAMQEQYRDSCRAMIADSLARLRATGWKPLTL